MGLFWIYSCFELWISVIWIEFKHSQWNSLSVKFKRFIGLLWHLLGHRDLLNIHSLQRDISIDIRSDQSESLIEPERPNRGLITSQSSHHKNTEKAAPIKQSEVCNVLIKIESCWVQIDWQFQISECLTSGSPWVLTRSLTRVSWGRD